MDIDFIKWMVGYAEGFEFKDGRLIYYAPEYEYMMFNDSPMSHVFYPLLLQRVIEGINKFEDYDIIQTRSNVSVFGYAKNQEPKHFESEPTKEDQAKEQALKYIYEQEL